VSKNYSLIVSLTRVRFDSILLRPTTKASSAASGTWQTLPSTTSVMSTTSKNKTATVGFFLPLCSGRERVKKKDVVDVAAASKTELNRCFVKTETFFFVSQMMLQTSRARVDADRVRRRRRRDESIKEPFLQVLESSLPTVLFSLYIFGSN